MRKPYHNMITQHPTAGRKLAAVVTGFLVTLAAVLSPVRAAEGRFLGREEITLYSMGLKVEPAQQTVPKDIATVVSAYLRTPTLPQNLPPISPDAVVRATLRGPSFNEPVELSARPNTPFNIPPLAVPGLHTLENVRLVVPSKTPDAQGNYPEEVLLRGSPESTTIDVIEKLLITQVTARPLSAEEIREKGIVFDRTNFQAFNFSAAFAIQDKKVDVSFPVVLPILNNEVLDENATGVGIPSIEPPMLSSVQTLIQDTLKIQTQIPNLSVTGFVMEAPLLEDKDFDLPPIPGVVVIPGDIGFLNQFFSVMLMVGNVAPTGSSLVVNDLHADIVLPPGQDGVVGSVDDPLRMARTALGEVPRNQPVIQPGPDGKLGTADDNPALGPGESGNAEYLVEGRREGGCLKEKPDTRRNSIYRRCYRKVEKDILLS
ncbi:MAG: hypothetical protein HY548_01890 [Elusimicrobia bacterium]|nr:hypothetical protein [Elusimicrobiota bacterium]